MAGELAVASGAVLAKPKAGPNPEERCLALVSPGCRLGLVQDGTGWYRMVQDGTGWAMVTIGVGASSSSSSIIKLARLGRKQLSQR